MTDHISKIGLAVPRKDACKKVSGAAKYTADIDENNVAFGYIVRSPYHHAKIISIDSRQAQQVPGLISILTTDDIPGAKTFGALLPDQPVLAINKVRHIGEPVLLVIAETMQSAEHAAKHIQIHYEELPSVHDPIQALQPHAPLVHDAGNLLSSYELNCGNLDNAFQEANIVYEDKFSVQRISPGYMEPENALAKYNTDESITVWVNSQEPFTDQAAIASVLGLPVEKVQVKVATIGGAFGGKEDSSIAILTSFAAWTSKRSVRLVNKRSESFIAHPKRHPVKLHLKIGSKSDGSLTALSAVIHMDTGAYASYGPAVGSLLTEMVTGPYRIPNVSIKTNVVYTHSPYSGAMRGFGSPQAHFAIESAMDILAEKLQMDPLELRKKNILKPGDMLPSQVIMDESANSLPIYIEKISQIRERMLLSHTKSEGKTGVGFALSMQSMGLGAKIPDQSNHRLEWLPNGKVAIHLGAPDLGQGLSVVSEQIVAETLQIPIENVFCTTLDTIHTPNGGVTCASRMTYLVGNALLDACKNLVSVLTQMCSEIYHIDPEQLTYQAGVISDSGANTYSAINIIKTAQQQGKQISAEGTAIFPYPQATTPQHLPVGMPHVKYVFAAHIVQLEIDPDLGTVDLIEIDALHDAGKIINRAALEGQIEGGVSMGIGYALFEDVTLKDSGHWVDSFTEYLLPTAKDMPKILNIDVLEIPDPSGPFGAKGIAEIAITPTAPAIANAVYNASKVRVHNLPITPEKIIHCD